MKVQLSEQEQIELEDKVRIRIEMETQHAVGKMNFPSMVSAVIANRVELAAQDVCKKSLTKTLVNTAVKAAAKTAAESIDYQAVAAKLMSSPASPLGKAILTSVRPLVEKSVEDCSIEQHVVDAVREKVFSMLVTSKINTAELLQEVESLTNRVAELEGRLQSMADAIGRILAVQHRV